MPLNQILAPTRQFNQNYKLTPNLLSNLSIWLDGDYGVSLYSGVVTTWANKASTGSTYNFTQGTTANMPAYSATGSNGHGVLTFDGVNDTLSGGSGTTALTNNIGALTIYIVWSAASGLGSNQACISFLANGSYPRAQIKKSATTNYDQLAGRRLDADSTTTINTTNTIGTTMGISCAVFDWTNNDAFIYYNGALHGSNTTFLTTGNTSATNSVSVRMGMENGYSYLNGQIAEMLVFTSAHTNAGIRYLVNSYLGAKHGIAVT